MTFEQLECFQALEKYMNFTTAAEEIFISQSSLSKQIKALEKEMGVVLFDRNTRNISLTDAGMKFSLYVSPIMNEYYKMHSMFQAYSNDEKHNIRIVSIPILNQYRITEMVMFYRKIHPDICISILEQDAQQVFKSLKKGAADLAIIRNYHLTEDGLKIFPMLDDELVLITDVNHKFAQRQEISLSEASDENFMLLSIHTGLYNACIDECIKAGFMPRTQHLDLRVTTIKNMVANGEGVSLLMYKVAKYLDSSNISIVRLSDHPKINLCIVTYQEPLCEACKDFIDYATSYLNME